MIAHGTHLAVARLLLHKPEGPVEVQSSMDQNPQSKADMQSTPDGMTGQ